MRSPLGFLRGSQWESVQLSPRGAKSEPWIILVRLATLASLALVLFLLALLVPGMAWAQRTLPGQAAQGQAPAVPQLPPLPGSVRQQEGGAPACAIELTEPLMSVGIPYGQMVDICAPANLTIQTLASRAQTMGWFVYMPTALEPRIFLFADVLPQPTNLILVLSNGRRHELKIRAVAASAAAPPATSPSSSSLSSSATPVNKN